MSSFVQQLPSSELVPALLLGVAVPLTSLAMLAIGCGDKCRSAPKKKKQGKQPVSHKNKPGSTRSKKPTLGASKKKVAPSLSNKSVSTQSKEPIFDPSAKSKARTRSVRSVEGKSKRKVTIKQEHPKSVSNVSDRASAKSPRVLTRKEGSVPKQGSSKSSTKVCWNLPKKPQSSSGGESTPKQISSADRAGKQTHDDESGGSFSEEANKRYKSVSKNVVPVFASAATGITVKPQQLHYKATGGQERITLFNQSKNGQRMAVKVKCSDNICYRVNPVRATVEAGKSVFFDVYRNAGAAKVDKLVFILSEIPKHESDSANTFTDPDKNYPTIVIPLIAVDGKPAAEDKVSDRCACVVAAK